VSAPARGFRDPGAVEALRGRLAALPHPGRTLTFLHVCGTHEQALARWGLRRLLPGWIRLVAGPGCPVCVCPPVEIAAASRLSLRGKVLLATFGDMLRVPAGGTLEQARAAGGLVEVVLGPAEAVALARHNPRQEVVFFAVGFETTACTTAAALLDDPPPNFSVLSVHRLIAPALEALLALPDLAVDGFLLPGHAATVTGPRTYTLLPGRTPAAIAGFEPVDVLLGVLSLASQALGGVPAVDNQYPRAVRPEGNPLALRALEQALRPVDAAWRGLGVLPRSGLEPRPEFAAWDARSKFRDVLKDVSAGLDGDPPGCRCAEVMTGRLEPEACPLFGSACTPEAPVGACMVGSEGTCRTRWIWREA